MSGSVYGNIFKISTWGESHGEALGVVVDGCPAGLVLCEADIQEYLNRRKPGQSQLTTPRKESDEVKILSGIFEGQTTGTPISMIVYNQNQKSKDYSQIATCYRPGHADYTFQKKYGIRDYRGGGRSSGRETIGRTAGGAIALKILKQLGIEITAYTKSIGPICIDEAKSSRENILKNSAYMPDLDAAEKAMSYLSEKREVKDSVGGVIECVIQGMPVGVGETVFDKLDANLAKAMLSLGAVKGFEIGDGFQAATAVGSENNDAFGIDECGKVYKKTNHSGGVLGGMSDGSDIVFRVAVKPTPSIGRVQQTVNEAGEEVEIAIEGRHDPVVVPRAVVVVEAMAAVTIVDLLFTGMSSTMDAVKKIYPFSEDK
jgi:chorismate synthase